MWGGVANEGERKDGELGKRWEEAGRRKGTRGKKGDRRKEDMCGNEKVNERKERRVKHGEEEKEKRGE